jgi:dephospho-CoA kinase
MGTGVWLGEGGKASPETIGHTVGQEERKPYLSTAHGRRRVTALPRYARQVASDRPTVLITGNPGSGKTTMAAELTRLGQPAIDADDEIARWEDGPDGRRWTWDRDRLERAIRLTPGLIVCGISFNMRDMLDLFDRVFLVSIDAATQIERLKSAGDRNPALWQPIIDGRPVFEEEMKAVGAILLDGRRSVTDLASQVIQARSA